ncbi:MAG: glycogen synthase [Gammaproteobacteria bacterium]|nr:glycogen synthase [Gammaproteobacteria bacterium]
MNILFAAVECYPFAKVGGLGDVIGSLPKELNKLSNDCRVIMPFYKTIKEDLKKGTEEVASFKVFLGKKPVDVTLLTKVYDEVRYYFIQNEDYYGRDRVYDFEDEEYRWALFQLATIEALNYLDDFKVDILNCHDWHTGMIPYLIKNKYYKEFGQIKTIYTIHNVIYQGDYERQTAKSIFNVELSDDIKHDSKLNFMKAGITCSNYVNTVSETYAKELLASEFLGHGMSQYLRERAKEGRFIGIINGIDYEAWNPKTDKNIPLNYSFENYKEGKEAAKKVLYEKLGVDFYTNVPCIGIVSRLTQQKGLDLIMDIIEELVYECTFKFIVIGTGDPKYEDFFKELEKKHPYKVKCYLGYSDELAHLVYAASDMFLMPSLFEPCGLGQMIALRYGSLPIVRETGGLKDSVEPYNEFTLTGNGFSFTNYNSHDMHYVIKYAFRTLNSFMGRNWDVLVDNAMKSDCSWASSAKKYLLLYRRALLS